MIPRIIFKLDGYTFRERALLVSFLLPVSVRVISYRYEFAPLETICFKYISDVIMASSSREENRKSQKLFPLEKWQ